MMDAPEWMKSMQPGRWYRISGDDPHLGLPPTQPGTRYLKDNDPARDRALNPPRTIRERARRLLGREWLAPWRGSTGFPAITEAWNSAVYASELGAAGSMVVYGGGHNTYFGSDVHAFDLADREWRRLTDGYVSGTEREYGEGAVYPTSVYPDGSPLPPHTYDYVQYDALRNNYLLLKGQSELGPQVKAVAIPHILNLDSLRWSCGPRHPSAILNSGGFSTWDAKRRILWGHSGDDGGGNAFVGFSPDGENRDGSVGTWREFHPNKLKGEANHNAMQYHPNLDRIVLSVHARNGLMSIDPNRPGTPAAPIESRGDRPCISDFAALEYSTGLNALVYYSANQGTIVYAVDVASTAQWRALSDRSGLDPIADAAAKSRYRTNRAHTFGRFRIASFSAFDVALLVRHTDSPVYSMRLFD